MHESRRNDSHESHCATSTTLDFEFKVLHATAVWRHGPKNKCYSTLWRHGHEIMRKLRHNHSHESHRAASKTQNN
eukprot:CAMPEP_0204126776 /NCGR_PEP_ID=MMETSP0361-20130328/11207_1 /ASSEMBLY_ACC=CAM_ASM_000343 /TAXON_ID=268821 /ORGANISM="Scrippsiella Hangoei, Strain SHTV-5" /LENGTH=74 /DNA_ID=CAMNT_0051078715 /DNA_START=138 /DNA_END=359 /DNA_ORIENTATION=-